ncbi:MAG: hypothetical protein JWN51_3820 [Phycisphaerales bacterium]|nr:hypothetical protein [Phycisphaerales bacterium]
MKTRIITSVLVSALLGIGAGCNKDDGSAASAAKAAPVNPVATVNLESIGKTMGWTDEISKTVRLDDVQIVAEIDARAKPVKDAFEDKKKEIAKAANISAEAVGGAKNKEDLVKLGLSPKQVDDFLQAFTIFQQGMQQLNNIHQQVIQQRQAVIAAAYYREALQPVIRRVATANNRTIVIALPNPAIYFSDASVDLTEKVVDDLQKNPGFKVTVPELQHIHWQDAPAAPPASGPATQPGAK